MIGAGTVRGTGGELRVGYQRAATLGVWTLDLIVQAPRGFTLRAEVLDVHDYWGRQLPLDLALVVGKAEWTWPGAVTTPPGDSLATELRAQPVVTETRD